MSSLSEHIQLLHIHGFSDDEESIHVAENQIKEIDVSCSQHLTRKQLGLYCSLLFDKDKGILKVLMKNVAKPQHKSIREAILVFLASFVPRIGSHISSYSDVIRNCCIIIFRSDRYAKNKVRALQILIELLSKRGGSVDENEVRQIVKVLFEELASSRSTSTVKGKTLHALGVLARYLPEYMTNSSERLFEIFLRHLGKEMETSSRASDLSLIEGCLLGLHALLFSFTSSFDEEPASRCRDIFKYAWMSLRPQVDLSRYAVPMAGMKLIKDHAAQFGPLLLDRYEDYYLTLYEWFEHKNYQLKHEAHAALDSFLQQVASAISDEELPDNKSKEIFTFFIRKFKLMMNSSESSNKLTSLAVRGYGLWAGPCGRYLSTSDVRLMFTEMMGRCEKMFLSDGNQIDDNKIHQLPSFVQSLASITKQLEISSEGKNNGLSESFMASLCRLCVLLIGQYPRLNRKFHFFCHCSLISAIQAFEGKPEVRQIFLERIIYQGLIRSCSHVVALGEERTSRVDAVTSTAGVDDAVAMDVLTDSRTITYKDFLPLWSSVMGENRKPERGDFVNRSSYVGNLNEIYEVFTSIFITTVMKMTAKLNLATAAAESNADEPVVNPGMPEKLEAENMVDFKLFVNLVDLIWDLFPDVMLPNTPCASAFNAHCCKLVQHLVALSTKFPLVSGYYKLLATVMRVAMNLNYFVDLSAPLGSSQPCESMDTDDGELVLFAVDRERCSVLVQKFAIEVAMRSRQYKDDLLASCLFFILSLPTKSASGVLPQLLPALQRACALGTTYTPLAEAILSALERWKSCLMNEKVHLKEVVLSLRPFLHSSSGEVLPVTQMLNPKKKSKSRVAKQKLMKEADEPARKKIHSRVVRFLGSLGGDVLSILEERRDKQEAILAWDKDVDIRYAVPFRDLKPEIKLDLFLPRVMEVASQSNDRRAKIAACELLHSITLYTIGRSAQASNVKSVTKSVGSLYKKLFPLLLRLACEVDMVCKQMFEPLVQQIIHWFTNNKQSESPSTVALLDAIMDGLLDDENASVRELSARSVSEFLKWSMKQNTQRSGTSTSNAKSIFKRIYSMARHPSSAKRLGASVAFNHIYKVFREQNTIVSDFTLEILITFMDCLALAHEDDVSLGTQTSCVQAIQHLERIIKVKCDVFNKPSNTRRAPRGISATQSIVLADVVEWLFDQCGRAQTGSELAPAPGKSCIRLCSLVALAIITKLEGCNFIFKECRHQCMRLFCDFVKLLPDASQRSPVLWIKRKAGQHGFKYFLARFERGGGTSGIWKHQRLSSMCTKFATKTVCNWFELVLAALESYSWILDGKLMTPEDLLSKNASQESKLFASLRNFVCDLAHLRIEQLSANCEQRRPEAARIQSAASIRVFTPQDIEQFNKTKCSLISRTLQFVTTLYQRYPTQASEVIPSDFWEPTALPALIAAVAVSPASLGFDPINDLDVANNLHDLSMKILTVLSRNLAGNSRITLVSALKSQLLQEGFLPDVLPAPYGSVTHLDSTNTRDLLAAYRVLHTSNLLTDVLAKDNKDCDISSFVKQLMSLVFDAVIKLEDIDDSLRATPAVLSPADLDLGNRLLDVIFDVGSTADLLVDCLYNNEVLMSVETGENLNSTRGRVFASTFADKINEEICARSNSYIPLIIDRTSEDITTCTNLLNGVLEYLASNRPARKKYSSSVCCAILDSWNRLRILWHDDSSMMSENTRSDVLSILRKILVLDTKVCKEPNHPAFDSVFEMYTYFLTSKNLTLTFKLQALDLLSFFTLSLNTCEKLKSALECLIGIHFPLRSTEFTPGSASYNDYCSAVRKFLICLELSGSAVILQIVMNIYCRENEHAMADEIQQSLHKCISSIPVHLQREALEIPFRQFRDSRSVATRRLAILDILVPMATNCDTISIVEFYSNHVCEIVDVIKEDTRRHPESNWLGQLERKSLCYRMLELMFSLLSKQHLEPSSTIGQAYSKQTGSKDSLAKTFMLRATRDRNEDMQGQTQLLEERRKFHCSVYNAMMAAVICTQADAKWYKAFLFDDNPSKNQFLLNNVIDASAKLSFEIEIDEPLKKRKRFVAIRMTKREETPSSMEQSFMMPYMASIAGSSLSEEVDVFDSNRSRTLPHGSTYSEGGAQRDKPTVVDRTEALTGDYVELDADKLNQHECMAPMVALITHMHQNRIGFPAEDAESPDLPSWMSALLKKCLSSSTHPNIRLFIAKLVINCQAYFRKYAKHWIIPLVQTILREDCGSAGIDVMVCDVMATILSWNDVAIPEDNVDGQNLVRGLVEKLSQKLNSDNRSLLRHNLDLIKTTLECWGSRIKKGIDPSIVYKLCESSDPETKANFAGLQLLGAFLANGISPYAASYVVERNHFFERIFANILYKRKEIYDSASEVAGMTLKHLTQVEKEADGEIHSLVASKLSLLSKNPKRQDIFITCLHKVATHHPPCVQQFLGKVMGILPKAHGELRLCCYEIIYQGSETIPDLLTELKLTNFSSMLSMSNQPLQLVGLRLCQRVVARWNESRLSHDDVMYFFPEVTKYFPLHPSPTCRQEALALSMEIYDQQKTLPASEQSQEIISLSKIFLLKMLNDPEEAIRNQAVNFWSEEKYLPVHPTAKLSCLLGDLYDPALDEMSYMTNVINLLLQSASLSPDFERPLFEHPLSECVFQEYAIDNRWQSRHMIMTPLFVDTLQAGSGSPASVMSPAKQPNVVMATQEGLQFTATVDVSGRNTYNWMTGGSLDTFSSLAVQQPERKSALISSYSAQRVKPAISHVKPGIGFGSTKLKYEGKDEFGNSKKSGVEIDVERLRRRYSKEADQSRWKFAKAQEIKRKRRESAKKEEERRRESEVQLHRKYRVGELPDIEIPHRSIVAPLAAACQHDPKLASIVMTSLIAALLAAEKKSEKPNAQEQIEKIRSHLDSILGSSREKNPLLIGSILEVACSSPDDVPLDVALVASTALAASKHALGISLLEQEILKKIDGEPSKKRRRVEASGIESKPDAWLQLARIYKFVNDFDVLGGIFVSETGSNALTAQGLSLEARNLFKEARKVYENALREPPDGTSDVEIDLWEDCRLNSMKQMARWDLVNKVCDNAVNHYDELEGDDVTSGLIRVWDEPDFQHRYLDSLMHAKTLQLLSGHAESGDMLSVFFDDVMRVDDDRKAFAERKFSEHLAVLYIYKGDYDRARYYLDLASEHATQTWSSVDSLAHMRELEVTRVMPLISDLHDFLDFAQRSAALVSEPDVKKVAQAWKTRLPHPTNDSVTTWNDTINYRQFLLDRMRSKVESLDDSMGDEQSERWDWIDECKSRMLLDMMRSCYMSSNFAVAAKILSVLEKELASMKPLLQNKLTHSAATFYLARARHVAVEDGSDNASKRVRYYLTAYQCLQDQPSEQDRIGVDSVNQSLLLGDACNCLSLSVTDDISDETFNEISSTLSSQLAERAELRRAMRDQAFESYKKAVNESEASNDQLRFEAYIKLAAFCDRQIRASEDSSNANDEALLSSIAPFAKTMTTCVLRGMRHNVEFSAATLRYPRLLQLAEKFGDAIKSDFVDESTSVPSWTFLSWIGHMVALLDRDEASFVQPTLLQMAEDYPQGVIYPVSAAAKGFDFPRSDVGKKNKHFFKRLSKALHSDVPLARQFIKQLQLVSDPVTVFKDWKDDFCKIHEDQQRKKTTTAHLIENYQEMYNDLFQLDQTIGEESSSLFGSGDSPEQQYSVGLLRSKFANAFKTEVDALFGGASGCALLQMKSFSKQANELYKNMHGNFKERARTLKDYSPWLADYQRLQAADYNLEIPGQYDGRSRPLTEYHVTIVGFDDRVQAMASLRKPCRIIIRGSDEKDYSFLVKGGEDLRQDQRIEQIFSSINDMLNDDAKCRRRDFSVITYQVIPINSKVGLIEWVPQVATFLDLMKEQARRSNCDSAMNLLNSKSWVPLNIVEKSRGSRVDEYGNFARCTSYADAVGAFNEEQNKLPWDMLRQVYVRMSADAESFLVLRKRFTSSYGVMCVVHWLLGIGDRHPSNFMVSMTTGQIVGIDFGHAFGSATEVLPVPELTPFRLTRQLVNLLKPHPVKRGEFRQVMVHCLSALRSHIDEILPLLDVFVRDPSVDWTRFAKKSRSTEGGDATMTSDTTWLAQRKMKIVEKKLTGGNPATITCDEINHNLDVNKFKKYYCSIAKGDSSHGNIRSQVASDNLSVEDQVDCLLDQATDPNILGRTWQGWKSWL